jgi:hypothetical protein
MAGAKKSSRKGMLLSEEAQLEKDKKTKVTFRVENPNQISYSDTDILFCSSVLGGQVYCQIRGNERIMNKFAENKINEVVLTVVKVTGEAIYG